MKELKKIVFDLENRKFEINGKDVKDDVYELELTFKAGSWSLTTSSTTKIEQYSSSVFEYCKGKQNKN